MTLKQLYAKAKEAPKPDTPAIAFVKEIAEITKKSEPAVRRWLSDSDSCSCYPDALTQEVLARHFNTTVEDLFPELQSITR